MGRLKPDSIFRHLPAKLLTQKKRRRARKENGITNKSSDKREEAKESRRAGNVIPEAVEIPDAQRVVQADANRIRFAGRRKRRAGTSSVVPEAEAVAEEKLHGAGVEPRWDDRPELPVERHIIKNAAAASRPPTADEGKRSLCPCLCQNQCIN